jgi:hypothetical protein
MVIGRIGTITSELGSLVNFSYGLPYSDTLGFCNIGTNVRIPCNYYADWYSTTWIWFWKYDVTQMQVRDGVGGATQVVSYTYSPPNWHYSDDPTRPAPNIGPCPCNYWYDFHGHAIVTATESAGAWTEYRFYTGMDGDRDTESGGYHSATIVLSDGSTRTDSRWFAGQDAETRRIGTAGFLVNSVLNRSLNVYTATLTAGSLLCHNG